MNGETLQDYSPNTLSPKLLLASCQEFAYELGGSQYRRGLIDAVHVAKGFSERTERGLVSSTELRFSAKRIRPRQSKQRPFNYYEITTETKDTIEALPPHMYALAEEEFGSEIMEDEFTDFAVVRSDCYTITTHNRVLAMESSATFLVDDNVVEEDEYGDNDIEDNDKENVHLHAPIHELTVPDYVPDFENTGHLSLEEFDAVTARLEAEIMDEHLKRAYRIIAILGQTRPFAELL